jgi:uncharacterized membrane protein
VERRLRRRDCLRVLAGLSLTPVLGCGSGKSGGPLVGSGKLTRVELGRNPSWFPKVAVNDAGEVAFTREISGGYPNESGSRGTTYHAFSLTRDGWKNLHPGFGNASVAEDINNRGQVLLFATDHSVYHTLDIKERRAYLYSDGTFTEIRPVGVEGAQVRVKALADDGSVIGSYTVRSGDNYEGTVFLWRDEEMTVLPSLPDDMNARGQMLLSVPSTRAV